MPLLLLSCRRDTRDLSLELPKEEELYIFPFQTHVDTEALSCGYKTMEHWSDKIKKQVKKNIGEVTIREQEEIGAAMHEKYIPYPLSGNRKQAKKVRSIIEKMKDYLDSPVLDYESFVVETPEVNAFTIPGGNIYVTTGLLNSLESDEDALAYVIGHELGHSENGHTREGARFYKYAMKQIEDVKNSSSIWKGIRESTDLIGVLGLKYGSDYFDQSDEIEADITGMYLAYMAGYDPQKALKGLALLKQLDAPKPESDLMAELLAFFRTHPWSEDRENCAKAYVDDAHIIVKYDYVFEKGTKAIVATNNGDLNIRKYPHLNAEKLEALPKASSVYLICESQEAPPSIEKWVYILSDWGTNGWVRKKYLKQI